MALFASGFCGISYEILFSRLLGNLVGEQFIVNTVILMTFLVGIGFGSLVAHKFIRFLWLIEMLIGLWALGFTYYLGTMTNVTIINHPILASSLVMQLGLATIILIIPAILIGMCLPIFSAVISNYKNDHLFATSYMVYHYGGAAVVLLTEFVAIRILGIERCVAIGGIINICIGICLISMPGLFVFDKGKIKRISSIASTENKIASNVLYSICLLSVASAIFQITMMKITEAFLGPYQETFAILLFVMLLSIALGSQIIKKWALDLNALILINLVGTFFVISQLDNIMMLWASYNEMTKHWYGVHVAFKILIVFMCMGVSGIAYGAIIPAIIKSSSTMAYSAGKLIYICAMANAVGFLLMTIWLHRSFDYGTILLILLGISAVAFIVIDMRQPMRYLVSGVIVVASITAFPTHWQEEMLYFGHTNFKTAEILKTRLNSHATSQHYKGALDTVSIITDQHADYYCTNGYISPTTLSHAEKNGGAIAAICSRALDHALVLGVGSGGGAATTGLLFKDTDCIEINNVVLDNLDKMKENNFDLTNIEKINLIHDDAIHYLRTHSKKYDTIFNTVMTPRYQSASKLFTDDFFKLVKKNLTQEGIFLTGFDSSVGDSGLDIILNTLENNFKYCAIAYIQSTTFMLIASDHPIKARNQLIAAAHPVVGEWLRKSQKVEPAWLGYQILNLNAYELRSGVEHRINLLNKPILAFEMSRLETHGMPNFHRRVGDYFSLEKLQYIFPYQSQYNLIHSFLHAEIILENTYYTKMIGQHGLQETPTFSKEVNTEKIELYGNIAHRIDSAELHYRYGHLLMQNKKYQMAIVAFEKTKSINPKFDNLNFNLATCHEYLHQYKEAIAYYKDEGEMDLNDDKVLYRLGRTYNKMQRYHLALKCLEQAIEINPLSVTYHQLGITLEHLQRSEDADKAYEMAKTMDVNAL